MLSRRDKLLQQPWRDRRYKDHRHKVKLALPAIDDSPPPARPHVTIKLKKTQTEMDRKIKIENDNFNLLQRLNVIMKVNRLDNYWLKPLPKFPEKIGMYSGGHWDDKLCSHSELDEMAHGNYKCYACEFTKRHKCEEKNKSQAKDISLPYI